MFHKKIRIPREAANKVLRALGNLRNAIEFEDLTKEDLEAKKNFGDMIKRCEEMSKKISDFCQICFDFRLGFQQYANYDAFRKDLDMDMIDCKQEKKDYFDFVENEILENDKEIRNLVDSHTQIREDLSSLLEKKQVLLIAQKMVVPELSQFADIDSGEDGIKTTSSFNFMAGVALTENELKMRRMIFRVSRGQATITFFNLEVDPEDYKYTSSVKQRSLNIGKKKKRDDDSGLENLNHRKKVFTIIFPGGQESILLGKILKVCEIFQVARYPVPKNSEINEEVRAISSEILEKKSLIVNIERSLQELILNKNALNNKPHIRYSLYRIYFEQEKLIYTTLNKCLMHDTFLDGHVWIPKDSLTEVELCLKNLFIGSENANNVSLEDLREENENPPTYIPVNEFTECFQMVVNTYGVPRYQEINPGYFTIVTFPFLFGVMFGDIGHGLVVLLVGLYMCMNHQELKKGFMKGFIYTRYFILLLGFFSVFCGLLYNDFFSIPLYFHSCYKKYGDQGESADKTSNTCFYKFGFDPIWKISSNELLFMNSFKMKLSVILGVIHMVLGTFLKGMNNIYIGDYSEFFFVFLPELITMLILFGYMDLLIFAKWVTDYEGRESHAPDIKTMLMNIFLKFGKMPDSPTGEKDYWVLLAVEDTIKKLHNAIFIIFIIGIFFMFIPKVFSDYRKAKEKYARAINGPMMAENFDEENRPPQELHAPQLSDVLVNRLIDTVEYVLGTVSNTASYLRLWALSLAHSQLSEVFFDLLLGDMMKMSDNWFVNGLFGSILWVFFAYVTMFVLLLMDALECFLHCLRLHWVEFQSKFYHADGYLFVPFCFSQNIATESEDFAQNE